LSTLEVINALKVRNFSFHRIQSELKEKNILSARGWDELIKKYFSKDVEIKSEYVEKLGNTLKNLYTVHVFEGLKAVALFNVDESLCSKLETVCAKELKNISASEISDFISPNLSDMKTYFFTKERDNVSRIIFSESRTVNTVSSYQLDELDENTVQSLGDIGDFYKLSVFKHETIEAFDSILIRKDKKRLEIHIDIPDKLNEDLILKSISNLKIFISDKTGLDFSLHDAINLFPCIEKLYQNKDGTVSSLGHVTGTDSIKKESMNRGYDLRDEKFHSKGLEAVGDTNGFSITKWWDFGNGSKPEAIINGKTAHASSANPVISYVLIDKCVCKKDFEMVVEKIVESLK
jgi:hypothetical protein